MNKKQLVDWLLNDDYSSFSQDHSGVNWGWVKHLLTNGFKGYENMTVKELKSEMAGRTD